MNVKARTEYARAFEWFSFGEKREKQQAGVILDRISAWLPHRGGELPQITRFKVLNELIR